MSAGRGPGRGAAPADVRIVRGDPDDAEIAALVAALGVLVAAGAQDPPPAAAVAPWLRAPVLVPAADWTADRAA